ncbi:MAG: hypothetical protein ACI9TA_003005, partial [Reinekea sp.]
MAAKLTLQAVVLIKAPALPALGGPSVFFKGVVRRFHAASLISSTRDSRSGLSQTGPAGCQLRVLPDQRS